MLMTSARRAPRPLVALRRDRSGVAMIEFALALPVLLAIGMTGVEVANLAVTVQRVNQLAMMASDNAGRVRTAMDELDVEEVMIGASFAGSEIKFGERGRLILSSVEANGKTGSNAGYKIGWQRCFGARNVASSVGPEGYGATSNVLANGVGGANKVAPIAGSALMMAEIKYTYRPTVAAAFMPAQELSATQVFPVRERTQQALTNTSGRTDAQRRLCDAAHLSAS